MSIISSSPVMRFLFDVLKLAAFAGGGIFVFAAAFQILVIGDILSADKHGEGFGMILTQQAVYVWMLAILLGFAAIFIPAGWRWPLLLAPLYAPALFLVIRALAG